MLVTACSIAQNEKQIKEESEPISIVKTDSDINDIKDFSTNVKIYEENSRIAASKKLVSEYKLSTRIIDNDIYARIDFPEEDGYASTSISNSDETVVFDRLSNKILDRVLITDNKINKKKISFKTLFPKTEIGNIKKSYGKLSFKITENTDTNLLKIETPAKILNDYSFDDETLLNEVIYYDINTGNIKKEEYQSVLTDNTKVTTTIEYLYEERNNSQIVVGMIESESYDFPYKNDTSEWGFPIVESEDEIEEISEDELNSLIEDGARVFNYDVIIGDPSDPDFTVTTTTLYQDVELNTLTDSYFKLSL